MKHFQKITIFAFFLLSLFTNVDAQITNVDAAVLHPKDNNVVYLFKGNNYYRYDLKKNMASSPISTKAKWPGLPAKVDAALQHPQNKNLIYFFSGTNYYRFNWSKNKVDVATSTAKNWPGLPARIDAAINHPSNNNLVYLFSGGKYYRFNWSKNKVDVVNATDRAWPGLPAATHAAINHPTNKNLVYFFTGRQYYRFNWKNNRTDSGYPLSIASNWKAPSAAKATAQEIRNWFHQLPSTAKNEMKKAGITANTVVNKVSSMSNDMQRKLIDAGVPTDRQVEAFVKQVGGDIGNTILQTGEDVGNFLQGLIGN
jgi:hypothetical protein